MRLLISKSQYLAEWNKGDHTNRLWFWQTQMNSTSWSVNGNKSEEGNKLLSSLPLKFPRSCLPSIPFDIARRDISKYNNKQTGCFLRPVCFYDLLRCTSLMIQFPVEIPLRVPPSGYDTHPLKEVTWKHRSSGIEKHRVRTEPSELGIFMRAFATDQGPIWPSGQAPFHTTAYSRLVANLSELM